MLYRLRLLRMHWDPYYNAGQMAERTTRDKQACMIDDRRNPAKL
jgi:hypothetical protein